MLIGFCAYIQHGKDSCGGFLHEMGWKRLAFADKLREVAFAANPYIKGALGGVCIEGYLQKIVGLFGWEFAKKIPEVRKLLQAIGTEAGRNILGDNCWIDALRKDYYVLLDADEDAFITDVRFPNEGAFVKSEGGILVRVTRPNFDSGVSQEHESERYIADLPADIEIINDGDLDDLRKKLYEALAPYLTLDKMEEIIDGVGDLTD